jgi:hypothetical protein
MKDTKQTKHLKHGRYKTNQTFKHGRYKTNQTFVITGTKQNK